jgi:hypothetical protein
MSTIITIRWNISKSLRIYYYDVSILFHQNKFKSIRTYKKNKICIFLLLTQTQRYISNLFHYYFHIFHKYIYIYLIIMLF